MSQDMRLQLIIEAFNKTQAAWTELTVQTEKAKAEITGVNSAAATSGSALDTAGKKGSKAMSDVAQAGAAAGSALEETGKKGSKGLQQVHEQASRSHSMLGQMVQMAVIMAAVLGSKQLAESGIDYNRTLEISKLGISAIITSMGVVTDQQGRILQVEEKWAASKQISVEAQRELEKIGMTTAATYQELVLAYQGLLAPALAAKMTFRETLDLTGLMTNSVKSMGLPLNQIVQEGRDLVAGTIDQNSQLARSLQITNDDVKSWKEKGIVFQEIKKRLEGFAYASREFENTWDGAWSNFKDFAQKALGEGSLPLFEFLKQEMIKFSNEMVDISRDATGKILDVKVKPEVLTRIRELAEDLKTLIQVFETAVKWGVKLAEPAMYVAIAVGIGKITTAVRELSIASKGINATLVGAMVAATFSLGKAGYDAHNETDTNDVRKQYKAAGGQEDLGWLGPQKLEDFKNKNGMDNKAVAQALKSGALKRSSEPNDNVYGWSDFDFNKALWEKQQKAGEGSFDLKGPNKKSPAELKKERLEAAKAAKKADQDAIAEAELSQRQAFGTIDQSREEDLEANKEYLRKQKLLHEEEKIDDAAWIESQRQYKLSEAMINDDAIGKKIDALNTEWEAKSGHYEAGKALDSAYAAYSLQYDKLMLDATKATNAELVANDEARIASAKLKKKTDADTAKAAADLAKAQKAAAYSTAARDLSQVEMDEKAGILSTVEALQQKIGILTDLEALQQRDLDGMRRGSAEEITAWNSQTQAIEGTRQKLNQYHLDLAQRSPIEGMKLALRSYADMADNIGSQIGGAFTNAFKGMEDALVKFVQTGKLDFKDLANSIISDLIRIQIRASITGPLSSALNGAISGMFSGGGIGSGKGSVIESGTFNSGTIGVAHDGGLIVPRFHFGGLATDEVPAILQTRERVLSREQAGLFEKFVNKTEGGNNGNVQVNVINQSGTQVSAEQSQPRFDGEQMIVNVVLKKLKSDPGFRNAMATGGAY